MHHRSGNHRAGRGLRPAVSVLCLAFVVMALAGGCASFYEQQLVFQRHFAAGDIDAAKSALDEQSDMAESRNRLLYFLQQGVINQMLGEYEESNRWFEQAYLFTEDVQQNRALDALSFVTNPTVKPYEGEDFEVVLIHYYMALNYLRLHQFDEALVSCRRVNITLQALNDKYETRKNRYKRDAFAHVLMGLIFEATGDMNSAFISYRNAYEIYEEDYRPAFGVGPPEQLRQDLMRTAYLNGFREELEYYEKQFGQTYAHTPREGGELVFFWLNGLGPVKAEWGINFVVDRGDGGMIIFANDEYGMSFPFQLSGTSRDDRNKLTDLKVVRAAFPKYVERPPVYRNATLAVNGETHRLQLAENVNAIALSTLEDRMLREFATSLLRLAIKQGAEELARRQSDGLGTILSLVNAATEKADTRNWQTLPYSISYARVSLPAGSHEVSLLGTAPRMGLEQELTFPVTVKDGETVFNMYHTLQSEPVPKDVLGR